MRRSNRGWHRRLLGFIALLVALSTFGPAVVWAALEDDASHNATTKTNPWDDADPAVYWRKGWGKSLFPELTLTPSTDTTVELGARGYDTSNFVSPSGNNQVPTQGFYYLIDRSLNSVPAPSAPQVNISPDAAGSTLDHTFDILGVYNNPPTGGWNYTAPGLTQPYEGIWYVHIRWFNQYRLEDATGTVTFRLGIDATPPGAIPQSSLLALPFMYDTQQAAPDWSDVNRRSLTWPNSYQPLVGYDALSGIGLYRVRVNGDDPIDVPATPWMALGSITVENLSPGENRIDVYAVDRATNESPLTTKYAYIDPDVPTVTSVTPVAGGAVPIKARFSAIASDSVAVTRVEFRIDSGAPIIDTAAPYAVTKDMSRYAAGRHTLRVTAVDKFGHRGTVTQSFYLDKTPPALRALGDSPDPFYPIISDGIRDAMWARYRIWERCTIKLQVYNRAGRLLATRSKSARAGSGAIKWDGKNNSGSVVSPGTYYYRLVAIDRAGNPRYSAKCPTSIKNYQLVRTSDGGIRVVPR